MADFVLPPDISPSTFDTQLMDYSGASSSPFSGTVRTVGRGQRWAAVVGFRKLQGLKRSRVLGLAAALQGKNNRIWLSDPSYQQAGAFPGGELFTNPRFLNGTTGWNLQGCTLSVQSGRLRLTNTKVGGATNFAVQQIPALTGGVPYALRGLLSSPVSMSMGIFGAAFSPSNLYAAVAQALFTNAGIPSTSGGWTNYPAVFDTLGTATMAGMYGELHYASLQQCALLDNAPNLFLQSNAFGTAPWSLANATIGLTNVLDPNGTGTAVQLLENATNGAHATQQGVTVATAAGYFTVSASVESGTRGWCYLQLFETLGSTVTTVWFNTGTGAFGTTQTGANWAAARVYAVNQGGGWYRISLTARKTNAATTVQGWIAAATGDTVTTYAGVASAIALNLWHGSFAASGVPVADSLTTSATNPGTGTTGNNIQALRGLPVSTSTLLAIGDRFEINGELKMATADLNSDAAGLGVAQFEPAIRAAHPDGDPVIIGTPLGRFAMISDAKWKTEPLFFSDFDLQLIEA